jgi:hypothetical protein
MVSMPTIDEYNKFFDLAVAEERVTDPAIIEEARYISNNFYYWYDFTLFPKEIMLAEKKLAFTKDWDKVGFFSSDAYYRGVIDNTIYSGDKNLVITDYKTSRAMLKESQIKHDPQLKSYVKMMVHTLGRDNVESVTIRIVYMRYKNIISHTFEGAEIDNACDSIQTWIDELVSQIESKGDNLDNYECVRNQYCSRCHLREDGVCPLFKHVKIEGETFTELLNEDTCKTMWKESESLKDKYKAYQKSCKEFIETTDALDVIDDSAVLDKHLVESRKYSPEEVVKKSLEKGYQLIDILPFMSISETNAKKLFKKAGITITDELIDSTSSIITRTKFEALTREEMG